MRIVLPFFGVLAVCIVAVLVYWPGLHGAFVFDDVANITRNSDIATNSLDIDSLKTAAFSGFSGPLQRPLSMLSFAANYYAAGLDPYYFKLTNLLIHLFNGVGIFILTGLLLSFYRKRFEPSLSASHAQWMSLAVAAAWLLHPFTLTSVLYVVQRMTSLSALFSIWGLVVFIWGRTRLYDGKSGALVILASLLLFTPLAALSKESGVLLPLLMLVAEVTLFTWHTEKLSARRFLIGFYALSVLIPVAVALSYVAIHSDWLLAGYANRGFGLFERLMTETRVLWFYMGQIVLPNTAQMGLYHDDIPVSHGLLQPVSTIFAAIGLVVLGVLAVWLRKKAPLVAFGVGFFVVGHALESTIYPLDIAYEHRNYLPMYGIVLAMFFYLLHPVFHVKSLLLRRAASFLLILMFAFGTFSRATAWANPYDFALAEFNHHPNSVRANIELGYVYDNFIAATPEANDEYYHLALQRFEHAAQLDKNDIAGLTGLIMSSARRGKQVEAAWVDELSLRLEHAPYAAITSDKLLSLTTCHLKGECKLPSAWVGMLLDSALRNRTLSGLNRAKIFYGKSIYLIN
ncbi:MAG: hypothetical protein HYZ46_00555, partial [Nitrosomonadales bacterium]|nr:hypothetical protein [Nitrosomonadales bacterium]